MNKVNTMNATKTEELNTKEIKKQNAKKIEGLKEEGYDIVIRHFRPVYVGKRKMEERLYSRRMAEKLQPHNKGGTTVVTVFPENDPRKMVIGVAKCSFEEHFCYCKGLNHALNDIQKMVNQRVNQKVRK